MVYVREYRIEMDDLLRGSLIFSESHHRFLLG